MQKNMRIMMALLVVAALATLVVPIALSQGYDHRPMGKRVMNWTPDEIYNVISVTGTTGQSIGFDILASAIKGKDGKVIMANDSVKRSGTYYFANDTAIIPFASRTNQTRPRHMIVDYGNASVKVAGASAVVTMKNLTMTGKGTGEHSAQFGSLGVYLPNGKAKSYALAAPARIMRSADNTSMIITGNPSVRAALQDIVANNARFPADAKPVMLKDVDAAK